jgi:hypothetical protein
MRNGPTAGKRSLVRDLNGRMDLGGQSPRTPGIERRKASGVTGRERVGVRRDGARQALACGVLIDASFE